MEQEPREDQTQEKFLQDWLEDLTKDNPELLNTEPSQEAQIMLRDHIKEVFSKLTERESEVLRMRFGLDDGRERTLKEIGEEIGRSASTAWRIERQALTKLRRPDNISPRIQSFLE